MNIEKIQEQFHYFNIQADIDSVFGNWAVSTDGDVVNSVYPYAIMNIHLMDTDWLKHMKEIFWFKPECEVFFKQALNRASEILNG